MPAICFYFQVHQPYRLRPYSFFEIGSSGEYEDHETNSDILNRISDACYIPANTRLEKLIAGSNGKVKVAYSISGLALEQFANSRTDVLSSFQNLAAHKSVEFLAETYYHSLASLFDLGEFHRQRILHQSALKEHLGREATVFRNTELLYSDHIARELVGHYAGVIGEGVDWYMEGKPSTHVFKVPKSKGLGLLLRNHRLSDAISFQFLEGAITAESFLDQIANTEGEVVNLFLDYETFGEHLKEDTGIFDFLEEVFRKALERKIKFTTPSRAIAKDENPKKLSLPSVTSWADQERDDSAWNGNDMQRFALKKVYELGPKVLATQNMGLIHQWGKLQTSDHFYYMSTKGSQDGEVHEYFNPFSSPYNAYIHYMNVLSDLELRIRG